MKPSLPFAVLLIMGSACEIDDDFGRSNLADSPGERIGSSLEYISKMIWYQDDKVLLHQGHFSVLDLNGQSTGRVTQEQFQEVLGVTDGGMAIGILAHDDGTFAVRAVNLEGSDYITLSSGGVDLPAGFVYGDDVFYSETGSDFRQSIFRHNVVTNQKVPLMEDGVPLAISPDGTRLLYSQNQQYITYDFEEGIHIPVASVNDYPLYVVWNNAGILGYFSALTPSGESLQIRNLETGSVIAEPNSVSVSRESVVVSRDGQRYTYATTRCGNPYYVYDCYDQPTLIAINEGGLSGPARELARHQLKPEDFQLNAGTGAFAPDASAFVYSLAGGIYYISLNE